MNKVWYRASNETNKFKKEFAKIKKMNEKRRKIELEEERKRKEEENEEEEEMMKNDRDIFVENLWKRKDLSNKEKFKELFLLDKKFQVYHQMGKSLNPPILLDSPPFDPFLEFHKNSFSSSLIDLSNPSNYYRYISLFFNQIWFYYFFIKSKDDNLNHK